MLIKRKNHIKYKHGGVLKVNKRQEKIVLLFGSLTLAHSQNSQMSFMYGFFFVKFLFFTVVCVVIVI